jgi:hypothetical protein
MLSRSGHRYGLLSLPPYLRLIERVTFTNEDSGFCRRNEDRRPGIARGTNSVREPFPPVLPSTQSFAKMTVFERSGDRVLVILSSGDLAGTQAVIRVLKQRGFARDRQGRVAC